VPSEEEETIEERIANAKTLRQAKDYKYLTYNMLILLTFLPIFAITQIFNLVH
jgi:hypothetical protein